MSISAIPHAQQIIGIFKQAGIHSVIISPGSRNAPLTLSFTKDDFFDCYSIVDERSASHVGLGMAQQMREPVVLLCTSGSALLNYFPAVAEAFYSEVPLIVLSADRPPYKVDIGDGQTIQQKEVYGTHVLDFVQMQITAGDSSRLESNRQALEKAINTCKTRQGPIHINCPFEEPLYNEVDEISIKESSFNFKEELTHTNASIPKALKKSWAASEKVLVIVGGLHPSEVERESLEKLAQMPGVLMMTEVSSNVTSENTISGIDLLLAPIENEIEELEKLRPDLLLTIGGMVVSKKIKQFLRKYPAREHWHLGNKRALNTYGILTGSFSGSLAMFLDGISERNKTDGYADYWKSQFAIRQSNREQYIDKAPWTDLSVFRCVFNKLPDKLHLQLGNSSTIRYAQLFTMKPYWQIFCNRGTSGIDGSTSTAIGAAIRNDLPSVFISGDLSFFYDVNGLWNDYIPKSMVFIVINNSGGGIFRILPGDKNKSYFKKYFETRHNLDCRSLADRYGLNYSSASDEGELESRLEEIFNQIRVKPVILEVFTAADLNDQTLLNLFKNIR